MNTLSSLRPIRGLLSVPEKSDCSLLHRQLHTVRMHNQERGTAI